MFLAGIGHRAAAMELRRREGTPVVERLGGAEPVRKLRASVSAALTVEAKPLPEWQRNMGATGKK